MENVEVAYGCLSEKKSLRTDREEGHKLPYAPHRQSQIVLLLANAGNKKKTKRTKFAP